HPQLYTLSLHDALPISTEDHCVMRTSQLAIMWFVLPEEKTGAPGKTRRISSVARDTFSLGCSLKITGRPATTSCTRARKRARLRSEEHTSELQSLTNLV